MMMIAAKNNPYFSGKELPTLKQIAEAPLIVFAYRGWTDSQIEHRFALEQLKPNIVITLDNFFLLKRYVSEGMGIALMSGNALSPEDEQHFNIYNLNPYFSTRRYGIFLNRKKYLSPMVKAFVRTIKPDIDFLASQEHSEAALV
jgi:LysR family cys regulon transcriptional activator